MTIERKSKKISRKTQGHVAWEKSSDTVTLYFGSFRIAMAEQSTFDIDRSLYLDVCRDPNGRYMLDRQDDALTNGPRDNDGLRLELQSIGRQDCVLLFADRHSSFR